MERRMVSMNWDQLDDLDDDDEFYESTNRISAVVPLDVPLSEFDYNGEDDQEFDDSRVSFSNNVSCKEIQNVTVAAAAASSPQYEMWMMAPGSITDRRRKLLQGMGLNSNKDFARISTTKLNKAMTKRLASRLPAAQAQAPAPAQNQDQAQPSSSCPVLVVRCRSDSDIDTSSFNTKRRKEEMIGSISKHRLTRTSSELIAPSVGLSCQYANVLRVCTELPKKPSSVAAIKKKNAHQPTSSERFDSFFLIKNLDTGKEFIVKEYNEEGVWNKVSDLQTGKQLTMDEFEKTVGHSPVVKELMRRASRKRNSNSSKLASTNSYLSKSFRNGKKKGAAILKNLKSSVSGSSKTEKEKDNSKTGGGNKTSTDKNSTSEWVKARAHGKPVKEFSALHLCQEIQAHDGPIWTMRFSIDGLYLATAGEDKVIHVWEVQECDVMSMRPAGDDKSSGVSSDNKPPLPDNSAMAATEKKKKGKNSKKKGEVPDYAKVPEAMFGLSEKPVCTFEGHQEDVLDLSWSRSQLLLSSSMDKTVRLWDIETKNCLKQFAHRDYVTCIQFNPTDEDYFISGSLDTKIRLWSIPGRKVIDWSDLHDMITSLSYSPDGQGAIVGLHKGSCKSYSTIDCKLEENDQLQLHTKPKAEPKKITGFQFSPTNPSEVLVTSADSRIRILDGSHIINKLIGYKNTSSQFSAQYSADGRYIMCASEDSQVYIWKHEKPKNVGAAKPKSVTTTSYEHFPCTEVTVVQPWHGSSKFQRLNNETQSKGHSKRSGRLDPTVEDSEPPSDASVAASECGDASSQSDSGRHGNSNNVQSTAWGLVIVTAAAGGEIRVYQNVGLPVKVGLQTNLF
ncbi:WD repeat-containing protein 44-like [Cynara cardunculus var. scolymus]|uniref:WD repeat-containing protein 44-like n=1 Tax=Cynara cardunculus var. scolymus TaxID=59895 RepID=UPI000D62F97F|nr:WD repeat-containing protein 44-like [Cynara cardunculus var. scolymus]